MTIKHLLCDLDETLLHTLSTTKNAYDCVFDSLNMPRKTAAEIKKATGGKPKSEIFGYMLCGETFAAGEPYSLQTKKGLRTLNQKQMEETMSLAHDTFYNYIEQNHIRDASLVEGALTLLSYCQKNEVRLHIISSKSPEYLEQELDHFNLTPFFDKIYGSPKIHPNENAAQLKLRKKPHRGAFVAMFDGNPPPPEDCLVIGDGKADRDLAKNIGCGCITFDATYPGGIDKLIKAIGIIDKHNNDRLEKPISGILAGLLKHRLKDK